MNEFDFIFVVLIVGAILMLGFALLFGFTPVESEWTCQTYKNQGYETKVVPITPFGYDCWIKYGNNFVPLSTWQNMRVSNVGDVNGN